MNEGGATVCDAGPLIHLDEIGALDLLEGFGTAMIPDTVWKEAIHHRPNLSLEKIPAAQIVASTRVHAAELVAVCKTFDLDAGERSALALMCERKAALFLCDDAAARLAAEMLGFRVHGTIGIIVRAIRRGTRNVAEVRALLESLPQKCSLHLSRGLLAQVLERLPAA
jgi:predicted nucleic acid-binding protein